MFYLKKLVIKALQKLKIGSAAAPVLVKLTGKHNEKIHPKHLIKLENTEWYEPWIKKNYKILDVGCGNGQRAIRLAKKVKNVTGFDINKENISLAEKESSLLKVTNTKFYVSDAQQRFKEDTQSYDAVFFCDVIEHLNDDKRALMEIYRVLKKNGKLLLIAPNIQTSWKKMQKEAGLFYFSDPDHKREYENNELVDLLCSTGFKVLSISSVVYDTPLSGLIDLIGGFSLSIYKILSKWKLEYAKLNIKESNGFRIIAIKI